MALQVRLFGRFSAEIDGRELSELDPCRTHELLSYLLLFQDHPHSREALAETLWGDSSTLQSRKYLRQALWHIRSALQGCGERDRELLNGEAEWLSVNPKCGIWVDVVEFERAYVAAGRTSGQEMDAGLARLLRGAAALYRDDLLVDCYQDWCVYERERLQNIYLSTLDKLMGYCEASHEYDQGLGYGAVILRLDRARERTHQWLMRLQYLAGDRTGALRQYERCASALREELGVEPAESTTALYDQIRTDRLDGVSQRTPWLAPPAPATRSFTGIADRLSGIRQELADVEGRLRQDM